MSTRPLASGDAVAAHYQGPNSHPLTIEEFISALLPELGNLQGLSDADVTDLLVPHLDQALTWESAPPEWRTALEALDGPTLRLLVLGALRVGRRLPDALERARERVEVRREARAERREERRR